MDYVPKPPERELVHINDAFNRLDTLLSMVSGLSTSRTVQNIVSTHGAKCQVIWHRRWFRAKVLRVYPNSLLMAWLDWPEAQWPHFFLRLSFGIGLEGEMRDGDESWRLRWPKQGDVMDLPIVDPRFKDVPWSEWIKAVLRLYAERDDPTLIMPLPRERIRAPIGIVLLGDSGVGKSVHAENGCWQSSVCD